MLGEFMDRVRAMHPRIHCMANHVTANDCANLLLACGASPIMADAPEEAGEVTAICDALVLNLGTLSAAKARAMVLSGREANVRGMPVVFDPVGVGASRFRRETAATLLENVTVSVIRGNVSEIEALCGESVGSGGVDALWETEDRAVRSAVRLARRLHTVVALTGEADVVTDGKALYRCTNGHRMMKSVTGAGCMLSALTGALLAASPDQPLKATVASVCAMGVCGEIAHGRLDERGGNATYRNDIIDAMAHLDAAVLDREARYAVF